MPMVITGAIDTEQMLINVDTTAKTRVKAALVKKALEIQKTAVKMAPIDTGGLEKAIKVRGNIGQSRDAATGRFARTEIEVYIDMNAPVPERPGKTVGDYAYEIHEHQAPWGSDYPLGEKSKLKQEGQSERVGGGFMDRAVEANEKGIDQELVDIARDM